MYTKAFLIMQTMLLLAPDSCFQLSILAGQTNLFFPGVGGNFCGPRNSAKFRKIPQNLLFREFEGVFPYKSMVLGDRKGK